MHDLTNLFDLPGFRLIPGERRASWGDDLDEVVADFARRTGMVTTEAGAGYYTTQKIGTMCAHVVPDAVSRVRRETYGKIQTWFFIYDDWAEQLGRSLRPEDVARVADIAHSWFAESERDRCHPGLPAARSMMEFWTQIQRDTSPQWRERLRAELGGYFRSAVEEAELVRSGRVNGFSKASELRPVATAAQPTFTWSEYACGVELPREVVGHPFVRRISRASTMGIAYANDVIGLKADLLRGVRDNLVLSLQEEHGGDLQANVERAAAGFHRAAAKFLDLRARFDDGTCDEEIAGRPDVAVYLQFLEDWLFEGVKWQLWHTDRYVTTVRLTEEEHPNQLLALV